MRTEEEVRQFFKSTLRPYLEPLENYRKKKIKLISIEFTFCLATLLAAIIFMFISAPVVVILFFILLIGLAALRETINELDLNLRRDFKVKVLEKLFTFFFDNFTYLPTQRIAAKLLQDSRIIHGIITKVTGEDYMRFHIGDTSVHFCETAAYGPTNRKLFQGIFLSSTFNKNFRSETLVLPLSLKSRVNSNLDQVFFRFKPVHLEDPEFAKEFIVLSSDQMEARYILSTSMMKLLQEYRKKTGRPVSFSFTGNLMHCAVPNYTNLFEPALFESFLEFDFFSKSYKALKLYTDIVEDLHLNVRIWK